MITTLLIWNKIDDRTWRARALGTSYEIKKFSNQRDHYSLYQRLPDDNALNMKYVVSALDIELCKVRAQEHMDQSANRITKV